MKDWRLFDTLMVIHIILLVAELITKIVKA